MAQQGTVTITGFVGADPVRFGREGGFAACSFRVGSTRSYFHTASGEWKEHPTTWITIKAFRALAEHILDSVHTGDPVIVSGLLNTETWQQDGNNRSRIVIEANSVGHDMGYGTSIFRKNRDRQTSRMDSRTDNSATDRRADTHTDSLTGSHTDTVQPQAPPQPDDIAISGEGTDASGGLVPSQEDFAAAEF